MNAQRGDARPVAPGASVPHETRAQVLKAIENACADLATARHASHYLLNEIEDDWSRGVAAGNKGADATFIFTQSTLDARAWLAERVWCAVRDTDAALLFILNNLDAAEGGANG